MFYINEPTNLLRLNSIKSVSGDSDQLNSVCCELIRPLVIISQCQSYYLLKTWYVCLVLLTISSVLAAPGVTPANKKCANECSLDYNPVCAGPAGTNDIKLKKSFGNICVMQKYNCEKSERKCLSTNWL